MKINIYHIDTCLPDFFGGHNKAHLQVPVDRDTTIEDLRESLLGELYQGVIAGSDLVAVALSGIYPDSLTAEEADEVGLLYSQTVSSSYVKVLPIETNEKVWEDYCEEVYKAAVKAVKELDSSTEFPFRDLDPVDCEEEQVYAYFILEVEH